MLVISRRAGQRTLIRIPGEPIDVVVVISVRGGTVRLAIAFEQGGQAEGELVVIFDRPGAGQFDIGVLGLDAFDVFKDHRPLGSSLDRFLVAGLRLALLRLRSEWVDCLGEH